MIVRTPPTAAPPPTVSVERIELTLYHGELYTDRTYHPAEGMDLDACIKAIANPEHGVLELFACSRDAVHKIGKRGKLGSVRQSFIDGFCEPMEIESATAHFIDGTEQEIPLAQFELSAVVRAIVLDACIKACAEDA